MVVEGRRRDGGISNCIGFEAPDDFAFFQEHACLNIRADVQADDAKAVALGAHQQWRTGRAATGVAGVQDEPVGVVEIVLYAPAFRRPVDRLGGAGGCECQLPVVEVAMVGDMQEVSGCRVSRDIRRCRGVDRQNGIAAEWAAQSHQRPVTRGINWRFYIQARAAG